MLIAIPSDAPGGLDAQISEHFGHCEAFTLVQVENGRIGGVTVVENTGHDQGGCLVPVRLLQQHSVDTLLVGGMGARPLSGFLEVGIAVHFKEDAISVVDGVKLFLDGKCRAFGEAQTCGGGGECGGGHHKPVDRPPIEGMADVRSGRVVTLDYAIKDADGHLIDSSATNGPMRYIQGSNNILPGLEKALEGLEVGGRKIVELPFAEAFGERDERRVIEVPLAHFPPGLQVGALVTGEGPQGQRIAFTVIEIGDETVRLDGNHPLAGKGVVFDVTVVRVESATPEEIEHGHVLA
jgi:FKBP-type peptidyl-prolyl cis-trans isomerase 2/predicted Fe-Mo cluster-binding NifX family protein